MRSLILIAVAFIASVAGASSLTLEEIIAKNIAARGGLSKIRAINSYSVDGTMSLAAMGMEMSLNQVTKRPNKFRMDISMQGMTMTNAFDGTTAWMINPMQGTTPQKAGETESRRSAMRADLDGALVDADKKGYKLELVGADDVDGSPAYKIKVTDKYGEVSFTYIDATTWLEVKTTMTMDMMGQESTVDILYSDYRDVAGVQMPMLMEMRSDGQVFMTMSFSNPKVNLNVPDSRFAFPSATTTPAPAAKTEPAAKPASKKKK